MIQQSALRWRRRRGWRATKRVMAARAMTTIHQLALRRRRRRGLAGNEECDSGKSDGNDEKGGGRALKTATAMATATRRSMAAATREAGDEEGERAARAMVTATKRATAMATATRRSMAAATREAGDEEGDGRWRGRQGRWQRQQRGRGRGRGRGGG